MKLKKVEVFLTIMLLFGCNTFNRNKCDSLKKDFIQLRDSNKKADALKTAESIITDCYPSDDVLLAKSILLVELDSANRAIETIRLIKTNSVVSNYVMAKAYLRLGILDSVMPYIDNAIVMKGSDSLYFEQNNSLKTNRLSPSDLPMAEILFHRGVAQYERKEDKLALADFLFCIKKSFNLSESYLYSGMIYYSYGQKQKACEYLETARLYGSKLAGNYIEMYCND